MRWVAGLVCCLSLPAADVPQLQQLYEKDRMFQLREALRQPGWNDSETLFYRAVIECRFGRETSGIEDLHTFLAAPAPGDLARKANEELASALARIGRYGDAANALGEALRLTPRHDKDRADNENDRALEESLKDVAPQTVHFGPNVPLEAKHNGIGTWNVPVEVNGLAGEWIFDTGANWSTLSESEAARLGLGTRETNTYVNGSTQKKNPVRLAVARDLRFGNAHVSSVVFLVIPDKSLYIGPMKYQIRGILGVPVLRALGSVAISAKGALRIATDGGGAPGAPNLFFADKDPVVEAHHSGHLLQMFLDTGANDTAVYPSFHSALTQDEKQQLKRKQEQTGGAGGTVTLTVETLPVLRLDVLGRTLDLPDISLLPKRVGSNGFRDGVLGVDALAGGFSLDFGRMQLRLDSIALKPLPNALPAAHLPR